MFLEYPISCVHLNLEINITTGMVNGSETLELESIQLGEGNNFDNQ